MNNSTTYKVIDKQEYEFCFYYDRGGMNYFTGCCEPRGFYASVTPVSIGRDKHNKILSKQYSAFSGKKVCLLECKRWTSKLEIQAKALVKDIHSELLTRLLERKKEHEQKSVAATKESTAAVSG